MKHGKGRKVHNVVVGISEMSVSGDPHAHLTTYSLGSCLGITIYDPVARVGGMLHAMLPTFEADVAKARKTPAMYVDSGVAVLFRRAYELGAVKSRMIVKAVGGAELLDQDQLFGIGKRNYKALLETLNRNGVPLAASHVGGKVTRTVRLEIATGTVIIQPLGQPAFEI